MQADYYINEAREEREKSEAEGFSSILILEILGCAIEADPELLESNPFNRFRESWLRSVTKSCIGFVVLGDLNTHRKNWLRLSNCTSERCRHFV